MAMRLVAVAFLTFFATACADAAIVQTGMIRTAPTTFNVAMDSDVRQRMQGQLAHGSLTVVRLVIHNLRPRSAQALTGVRIFINKPDASVRTSSEDPHFAGAFVLGLQSPETILLNVAPTLSRLWESGDLAPKDLAGKKGVRVTFVPDTATSLPKNFALTFERLTFEVPTMRRAPR